MGDQSSSVMGKKQPISLGDVVNPSLLWASYPPGISGVHTCQRHEIVETLKSHFSHRQNRHCVSPEDLEIFTRVVMHQEDSNEPWLRGMIVGKKLDGLREVFEVFLVDVGIIEQKVNSNKLYPLPEKIKEIPTQAFLITLYGIEPLDVEVDIGAKRTVLEPSQVWNEAHSNFMRKTIEEADQFFFKTKEEVNNVKHGIFYVYFSGTDEWWNMNEKLVEYKFATAKNSVIDVRKYVIRNSRYGFIKQFLQSSSEKERSSSRESSRSQEEQRSPTSPLSKNSHTRRSAADSLDAVDEVDAGCNVKFEASDYIKRTPGNRPKQPIYPAGHQIPNIKKKSPASSRSTVQGNLSRNACDMRSDSRSAKSDSSQQSVHEEAWSEDENAAKTSSTTACQKASSILNQNKENEGVKAECSVISDKKAEPDSKPKAGFLKNLMSFFSRSNDNDIETSSSDESEIPPSANKTYDFLSEYHKVFKKSPELLTPENLPILQNQKTPDNSNLERIDSANENLFSTHTPNSSFSESSAPRNASNVSVSIQNTSNLSILSENHSTPVQNVSTASTSSGGKSRLQIEKERLENRRRSRRMSSASSETSFAKKDDDFSDSTSQSSVSKSDLNNMSQCNLSVASSSSARKPFDESSLNNSKSLMEKFEEEPPLPFKERVLAHDCCGNIIAPVESFTDFQLDPDVKSALSRLKVLSLYRLQSFACPLILDWKDVALVHKNDAGKTVSYVIPLLSLLQTNVHYRQLRQTNCPKVIIVCPWSSACENVAQSFKRILSFRSSIKVVTAYNMGKPGERDKLINLANGCDVLIATPRYLLHLFDQELAVNLNHVYHFVLDGCHDLYKYFHSETVSICNKISVIRDRRRVQVVAVSEIYNSALDKLIHSFMTNPTVLIANAMEAAVYGKCACKLAITNPENKVQALLDMLEAFNARELKTVIVCDVDSVSHLHDILLEKNYNCEALVECTIDDERLGMSHAPLLRRSQEGVKHPVIVCTDDALIRLNIVDAQILIHYDLPPTKFAFSHRYFSIFSHIPNRLVKNCEPSYIKTGVIVDTDSKIQFPGILDFIKRFLHKVEIPDVAEEIAKTINHEREVGKTDAPLCPRLLKFGECWPSVCDKRHVFINEIDYPQFIPKKGYVKVKILHVLDPSNFCARLLEFSEDLKTWTHNSDNYGVFAAKLNMHFMDETNQFTKESPVLGDMVVYQPTPNDFKRALIVQAAPKKRGQPQEFRIKLIDEGYIHDSWVPDSHLLTCPERFQEYHPFAIDLFVCGLKPVDLDHSWSRFAGSHIKREIKKCQKQETDGYFFVGKIMLALNSSLWLNPFECQLYLENAKTHVTKFSIKQELLEKNFAVKNPEHLSNLYELCRREELPIPTYETQKVEEKPAVRKIEKVKPQWAYLPLEEDNRSQSTVVKVFITHNDDPDMVFVQQIKFLDRLEELHNDINKKMSKDEKMVKNNWQIREFCVANFEGEGLNKWFRAQIIDKPSDEEVAVLYVDYGQEGILGLDKVAEISPEFITKLPFQAIECCLVAVRPTSDEWDCGAALTIDEFMIDDSGICKTMLVKAMTVETLAKRTGGHRYKVVLRDINDVSHSINRELIDRGYAKIKRSEALFLDPELSLNNYEPEVEETEDDSWDVEAVDAASSEVSVLDVDAQMEFYENFKRNYLENFDEELDEEDFKQFSLEVISKHFNRNPETLEFVNAPSAPAIEPSRPKEDDTKQSGLADAKNDDDMPPPLKSHGAKSPIVLWHQDETYIYMRVQLIGVEDYYFDWGDNFVEFQTQLKDDFYQFYLDFCGNIESKSVIHSAKGFYVDIKMKKQLVGTMWPRLSLDTYKIPWLKFNHDYWDDEDEDSPFNYGTAPSGKGRTDVQVEPDGYFDDVDDEVSLREAEARYDMPEDKYDPTTA